MPSHCCKRDLGTGLAPTGYKLMRRVSQKQKGSALDLLNKRNGNFNGKRGIKKNVQRSYICSVIAGHHCCSARAFALQPLAPSGATLRAPGVDRSARPSKGDCRAINAELCSREPLEMEEREEILSGKKSLDTRSPHISWIKNQRSWFVSRTRPCSPRLKTIN